MWRPFRCGFVSSHRGGARNDRGAQWKHRGARRPGPTELGKLATNSDALVTSGFLLLIVMPGAISVLA